MVAPRFRYELAVDWDNNGTWEPNEIIRDDLRRIVCSYGRENRDVLQGHSIGGQCTVLLRNTHGYYSPYNFDGPYARLIRAGRYVQVRAFVDDDMFPLWTGFLRNILPHLGTEESGYAELLAEGPLTWIDQARLEFFWPLATLDQAAPEAVRVEDQRHSGSLIALALDQIDWKGATYTLETDPYSYTGDAVELYPEENDADHRNVPGPFGRKIDKGRAIIDLQALATDEAVVGSGEGSRVRAVRMIRTIEETEVGFMREDMEANLVFEDRYHRLNDEREGILFSDLIPAGADYPYPYDPLDLATFEDTIYNVITSDQVEYYYHPESHILEGIPGPRTRQGRQQPLWIPAGTSKRYQVSLRPSTENGRPTGAPAFVWPWKNAVIAPVGTPNSDPGIHWDGDGNPGTLQWDLNASYRSHGNSGDANDQLRVQTRQGARSIILDMTNTNTTRDIYIVKLRVRGFPHYVQSLVRTNATNENSIREHNLISEYKAKTHLLWNRQLNLSFVQYLADTYGEARPSGTLRIKPRHSKRMARDVFALDASDPINVRNAKYGLAGLPLHTGDPNPAGHRFFVENIKHEIEIGSDHTTYLELSSMHGATGFWVLGVSRLGDDTRLSF